VTSSYFPATLVPSMSPGTHTPSLGPQTVGAGQPRAPHKNQLEPDTSGSHL
jgi:hypothetical protein